MERRRFMKQATAGIAAGGGVASISTDDQIAQAVTVHVALHDGGEGEPGLRAPEEGERPRPLGREPTLQDHGVPGVAVARSPFAHARVAKAAAVESAELSTSGLQRVGEGDER